MTVALPTVGVVSPMRMRKSVDLPAPLGPTTAQTSPAFTDMVTSSRAWTGLSIADLSRNCIHLPDGS